jgi:hypothetical protein
MRKDFLPTSSLYDYIDNTGNPTRVIDIVSCNLAAGTWYIQIYSSDNLINDATTFTVQPILGILDLVLIANALAQHQSSA